MPLPDPLSLPAGSLRHRVTLLALASTQDAFGQPLATWNPVLTVRAKIETPSPGRELFENQQLTSNVTHVVSMRYTAQAVIAPGMRAAFGGHTYEVQAVVNVLERNRVLRLFCLAINDAQ